MYVMVFGLHLTINHYGRGHESFPCVTLYYIEHMFGIEVVCLIH